MATAPAALITNGKYISKGVYSMGWSATVAGVGNPMYAAALPDKTFQLQGPTGGTSNIVIEGTNGSTVSTATWITLTTPTDGLIDFTNVTGSILKVIRENPRMIRPNFVTVTTGKTLTCTIIAR